ncbi:hypothetical protein GcM1_211054 [Golovinomyces cichoracearum]|uniref:Uncharacterized protein n=1 Tax=Golovinomyces cichoracearum TaxID=62708 RepID=A0A420IVA4_9PEZI|nr:hypothetical protein GcM1_211054 [Golovinomyces cichoracearum]
MSVTQHVRPNYPSQQGLPLSSPDNNVISTSLYKPPTSNHDQYLDGFPSAISMAHSPRTLYAQYTDSRAINGRGTRMDYRFRKDLNVLTGHDTIDYKECFNTFPITMQNKFFSNNERTKFAPSSRSITPDSFTQDYPLQDSYSPISRQSSIYFDAGNDLYPQNNDSKLMSNPKPKKSIAERRGKRINFLNPQVKISLKTSPNIFSQISACSLLSYQPSLLEAPQVEISIRNDQVQLATQTPRSLLKDIKEKQGEEENSFDRDHTNLTKGLLSPFIDRNKFCSYQDSIISMDIRNEENRANSLENFSDSCDSFYWIEDEDSENISISLDDLPSNVEWVFSPTAHYTNGLSASKLMSASNRSSDRGSVSSHIANIIDSSPETCAHNRPRAYSIAAPSKATRSTGEILQRKTSFFTDPLNSLDDCNRRHESFSHTNTLSNASTLALQPDQIINDFRLKRRGTDSDDSSSIDNTPSLIGSSECKKEISHLSCPQNEMSLERPSLRKLFINTSTSKLTDLPKKKHQANQSTIIKPMVVKKIESPSSSGLNQMTLRMTLTRPDLRLDEAKIYAWQDQNLPRSQNKQALGKGPLGGPDGWGLVEKERGVVKRFWNKVTHNRKVLIS